MFDQKYKMIRRNDNVRQNSYVYTYYDRSSNTLNENQKVSKCAVFKLTGGNKNQ